MTLSQSAEIERCINEHWTIVFPFQAPSKGDKLVVAITVILQGNGAAQIHMHAHMNAHFQQTHLTGISPKIVKIN